MCTSRPGSTNTVQYSSWVHDRTEQNRTVQYCAAVHNCAEFGIESSIELKHSPLDCEDADLLCGSPVVLDRLVKVVAGPAAHTHQAAL